jgi:putative ATP-binding cassette transporter
MLRLDGDGDAADTSRIRLDRASHGHLVIEDLCIAEPSGQVLIEHFSANVRRGERVLVKGDPAVTGSFFKVLGGLWPWGRGRVSLPGDEPVAFMPQRPFLPDGTLRAVVCYPLGPEAFDDADVRYALECAGLAWLAPRLDQRDDWEKALPLRAQQRLGFARVVLQRPAWVFMEEATDAFDPKDERLVLEMLHRELPDATLITISFHPGLEGLHQRELVLSRLRDTKFLAR